MSVGATGLDRSELNKLISPEIKHDTFYKLIGTLAATEKLENVLEIGSSSGAGSTEAFVAGLSLNPGAPKLFCIEVSQPRFEELRRTYAEKAFVRCYHGSSVSVDEFPDQKTVADFYDQVDSGLRKYPLPRVLGWLAQDIQYVAEAGVDVDVIKKIRSDHGIDKFDMVLIDGSEFTGEVEYSKINGAGIILLDDTNTYKCYNVRKILMDDPMYDVIADDQTLRNGYSAFRRRATPRRVGDTLPIHFFTIALNGEPFIRYHESVRSCLTIPWHWHIVEGVAALKHDTAWSVAGGGRVADELHDRGRSNDGTSAYLDELAQRFPENITIYRKPLGEFWDGKREMVNAPSINEDCLLWQVDNDELWTLEQIETVHAMFTANPDRTAARYWCWYYVGPTKIISTRYNYAQNPAHEWLRTWRYSPGAIWAAHEPPILVKSLECKTDIARINPFTQDEMERAGAVFHHFAYASESQLQFKEIYYGYRDARGQWRALQAHSGSGKLRDYLGWVADETMFDDISHYLVAPLATVDAFGKWTFSADDRISDEVRSARARPRILVDGVFWQLASSGIARVWENLLKEWVASGFADHVIVLDRAATAPRIPGVHYWTIARHEYAQTGADSLYLEEVCQRLGADLFVSTYYSTPTATPSFFSGYDMIPEMLRFPTTGEMWDEMWQEKRRAIVHAAAHSMISANSARDLEGLYPDLPRGQTHVALVGVAPEFSPPPPQAIEKFRVGHGLADKPYVIMVGERSGYGGYKNGALAFRALAQLPASCPLALICVGGQQDIEPEFREIAPELDARRLSLDDVELAAAYAGAHCLLYPSKYEGFGMPPLEAMACGAPAIVCRNSSLPEVVGDAAIFVDENDPAAVVKALLSLFDPTIRANLIAKGQAQAAKFTFARTAKIIADAFVDTHQKLEKNEIARPGAGWGEFRKFQRSQQNLPQLSEAPLQKTLINEPPPPESEHSSTQPSEQLFPQQSAADASETFVDVAPPPDNKNTSKRNPIRRFFKRIRNSIRKRTQWLASSSPDPMTKPPTLSKQGMIEQIRRSFAEILQNALMSLNRKMLRLNAEQSRRLFLRKLITTILRFDQENSLAVFVAALSDRVLIPAQRELLLTKSCELLEGANVSDGAIAAFVKALSGPDVIPAQRELLLTKSCELLEGANVSDGAIAAFVKALSGPDVIPAQRELLLTKSCELLEGANVSESAIAAFVKALSGPDVIPAQRELLLTKSCELLEGANVSESAIAAFVKALSGPDVIPAQRELLLTKSCELLEGANVSESAIAAFVKALSGPDVIPAQRELLLTKSCELLEGAKVSDGAIAAFTKALSGPEVSPRQQELLVTNCCRLLDTRHLSERVIAAFEEASGGKIHYSQEGEDIFLLRLLGDKKSGFFVDVGAHHATRFSNTYALYKNGWRGINIDAGPRSMESFIRLRPEDINLELAVSDSEKPLTFRVFKEGALNTFDAALAQRYVDAGWEQHHTVELTPRRLSDVLDEYLPSGQHIDLLSVDVEGEDLAVLRSNNWDKYCPDIIIVEAHDLSIYHIYDHPTIRFLAEKGFTPVSRLYYSIILRTNGVDCGA